MPSILTDKKVASQNYLPDYSYAGYHNGEIAIPKKESTTIYATDYGVIANDGLDDSKNLIKAIKAASDVAGEVVLQLPVGQII